MKLSISNIGWDREKDVLVYGLMKKYGFCGLEIAPTRIFENAPYEKLSEAKEWSDNLKEEYGFCVPSMQSIWYGRQEKLFGSSEQRKQLLNYTKKAIDFAMAIECANLVFGCPRNRYFEKEAKWEDGVAFFKEAGDYAHYCGTVIGMEANPPVYKTNYINDTASAIALVKEVDSKGFRLNLDIGTMVENNEDVEILESNVDYINHVHISEPNLRLIQERKLHIDLLQLLRENHYQGFVSIEIGKQDNVQVIERTMVYVKGIMELLHME
ncbi:MAG: sugar phosphate isomerase/epimerase [Lachnospiraceae bacterium]|nr:sugar phosphate isomerase/epimerase [Lachnospiraceae bacterium]